MIKSVRTALHETFWLRWLIVFVVLMAVGLRRDILKALGFADTGLPVWIAAGLLTALFLVYLALSVKEPISVPVAGRSRAVRMAYSAFGWSVVAVFVTAAFARPTISNPVLVVSAALLGSLVVIDLLARRKRANAS